MGSSTLLLKQAPTIAEALEIAREALSHDAGLDARLEARILLRQVTGLNAAGLVAHDRQNLSDPQIHALLELLMRRMGGEPIAYLLGQREFYGRDFSVTPAVLIPRPETELLVDLALSKLAALEAPRVLDLGCGSGCIALSIACERPDAVVTAVDFSHEALAVARANAVQHQAKVQFVHSDWYAALDQQSFDLIVSNPPYIPEADPHLAQGDLRFEPATALSSGADGLTAIRQIIGRAHVHLQTAAWLLIEHGYDQAEVMHTLLHEAGFEPIEQHRDLAGITRVSGGRLRSISAAHFLR